MRHDDNGAPSERLGQAILRLRAIEREILLLRVRDGLRVPEIAGRLGLKPRKAERLLARAIRRTVAALDRADRNARHG